MQGIWARILAGEVESPGRTSLRTLDVLKNITKEEADLFASVSDFVIGDVIFNPEEFQGNHPILSFYSVIRLQNVGLLYHASLLERTMKLYENQRYLEYQDRLLKIHGSPNEKEISIPIILLTDPGKQLYRIMECDASHDYLKSLSEFLSKQNCELSYTRIIDRLADGRIKHDNQFVTVPPEALKHSETGT